MKKCWVCEKDLEVIKDQPYQYKESGLDNVYLHGIIQYKCHNCGEEAPEIPNLKELHLLIGKSIICNNEYLSSQEIIYLRKELGLKGKEMAELLSVTPQEYSKWENSKDIISSGCDKHLRLLYILNADFETGKVLHSGLRFMKQMSFAKKAIYRSVDKRIALSVSEWIKPEAPLFREDCFAN
ncbi:MAG: helix-turn-helix domain-containing protein [Deltaproteobacteria bacterium]|nr:helix-turn-helix domain-containing protein [Deltaproteobacteria bacterium]